MLIIVFLATMRALLWAIVFVSLTGCSSHIYYMPEVANSCTCVEFDSLRVDAGFNNSCIYPILNLSCELPVAQLSELKDLTIALKRTENGPIIPCDSVSMNISNDSGNVMLLNAQNWPAALPDSMLTVSGRITLTIENHYLSILDNPERWFVQLKAVSTTGSRDAVFAYKAEKRTSGLVFH